MMEDSIKSQKLFSQNNYVMRALLFFILVYLVFQAATYFHYAYQMIIFPFDFDIGEGFCLQRAVALSQGESIYAPINQEPYTVMNYPPLFEVFLAGLVKIFGPKLLLGRIISVFATVISGYFIGRIVLHMTGKRIVAAIAGLLFFCSGWLKSWSVLCRVDMLSLSLTLAGLSLFMDEEKRNQVKYLLLSALCFVGAIFTRQSAIAAPLACSLFLIIRHYSPEHWYKTRNVLKGKDGDLESAFRFLGILVSMGFSIFILLLIMTKGEFWNHITTYTVGFFSWAEYISWLKRFLYAHGVAVFLSAIFMVYSIVNRRVAAVFFFWIFSFLVTITSGKHGAAVNYFLEFWAANCILMGLVLAAASNKFTFSWRSVIVKFFVIACVIFQLHILYRLSDHTTPSDEYEASGKLITDLIRNVRGDVISEYAGYMIQNGKKMIFQPFAMTQLIKRGLWDQSFMLKDIESNRFDLIIMSKVGLDLGRWTKEMNDAVVQNYVHIGTFKCFELSYFSHSTSELDVYMSKYVRINAGQL